MNISHIRFFREKAGFTQEQTAKFVNVGLATYQRWERGQTEPCATEIRKLCDIFGCSESELLNGPEEKRWNLKVRYSSEMPVLNVPAEKVLSELHIVHDKAMAVTLAGPFELWEDETKFEDFIKQLREEREIGLNIRKAHQGK